MNFPWAVVERGGQPKAADWTAADAARLRALVDRAHAMGLSIRFYTLNGHAPDAGQGWSAGYNFGSVDAVRPRWKAAIDAGVDFLATDQYELLAEELKKPRALDVN
jgi:glycerophosphoryl diester phosphodiesterase